MKGRGMAEAHVQAHILRRYSVQVPISVREISMQSYMSATVEYDDMTRLYSVLIFPVISDG